jgi:hypothetical protein
MTEAEWLDGYCDPQAMIEHLARMGKAKGQRGQRKLRLFACACCRNVWAQLPDERSRIAVEISERYAEGLASAEQLSVARAEVARTAGECREAMNAQPYGLARGRFLRAAQVSEAAHASTWVEAVSGAKQAAKAAEYGIPRQFLLDIFGNPFRRPITDFACLRWGHGTVQQLAQVIYEECRFGDLPILADALEEAGRTDADILAHCRGPGPHARGCWAVDLILGKG